MKELILIGLISTTPVDAENVVAGVVNVDFCKQELLEAGSALGYAEMAMLEAKFDNASRAVDAAFNHYLRSLGSCPEGYFTDKQQQLKEQIRHRMQQSSCGTMFNHAMEKTDSALDLLELVQSREENDRAIAALKSTLWHWEQARTFNNICVRAGENFIQKIENNIRLINETIERYKDYE